MLLNKASQLGIDKLSAQQYISQFAARNNWRIGEETPVPEAPQPAESTTDSTVAQEITEPAPSPATQGAGTTEEISVSATTDALPEPEPLEQEQSSQPSEETVVERNG